MPEKPKAPPKPASMVRRKSRLGVSPPGSPPRNVTTIGRPPNR